MKGVIQFKSRLKVGSRLKRTSIEQRFSNAARRIGKIRKIARKLANKKK